MNHKREIGPEMQEIIQNLNLLAEDATKETQIPVPVQRGDEAEVSGNTAASSPKDNQKRPDQSAISVPDDASIT